MSLGDSGSGLYIKYNNIFFLRGIISASLFDNMSGKCNLNNYALYTNVLKFTDWLQSQPQKLGKINYTGYCYLNIYSFTIFFNNVASKRRNMIVNKLGLRLLSTGTGVPSHLCTHPVLTCALTFLICLLDISTGFVLTLVLANTELCTGQRIIWRKSLFARNFYCSWRK